MNYVTSIFWSGSGFKEKGGRDPGTCLAAGDIAVPDDSECCVRSVTDRPASAGPPASIAPVVTWQPIHGTSAFTSRLQPLQQSYGHVCQAALSPRS